MQREELLNKWLGEVLEDNDFVIQPASSDASFRRYFRVTQHGDSYIVMDAPPDHEDVRPFIKVDQHFSQAGMNVPTIFAQNIEHGFLLLGDLGSTDYLSALNEESANALYQDAIAALLTLQKNCVNAEAFPPYNSELLQREMMLFVEWFLQKHLALDLTDEQQQIIRHGFAVLEESALQQPQVVVHRDYHSRNLMVCEQQNPGVLDFQDAVVGPVSYDLVSLLKDCYISWPEERVYGWLRHYFEMAYQRGLLQCDERQFIEWFDLMGMQRHLKAIGIFARLNYRDGKPGYLKDIPRTLNYVMQVAQKYPQLADMAKLLKCCCVDVVSVDDASIQVASH